MHDFCHYSFIFFRYDYENCETAPAEKMMEVLNAFISDSSNVGKVFSHDGKSYKIKKADNFSYEDPIDKSVSMKQASHFFTSVDV